MPICGWSTTTWRGEWSSEVLTRRSVPQLTFSSALLLLCRSYGDAAHCRKALHRAVQCTADYPEHVCEVLLTFERVEGELLRLYNSCADKWCLRNMSPNVGKKTASNTQGSISKMLNSLTGRQLGPSPDQVFLIVQARPGMFSVFKLQIKTTHKTTTARCTHARCFSETTLM